MKTNILICLIVSLTVCSCDKTPNTTDQKPTSLVSIPSEGQVASNVVDAKIGDFIVDLTGKKYRKVTDEIVKPNGVTVVDVWERVGDKQSWYTPTLSSKMDKNSTPMFNSLSRNPGEEYPTF